MSVGTYSVLSLKRARICFRQLSHPGSTSVGRWAGAPLQQERRSQCVTSRVQLSHQLLPARPWCAEEEAAEEEEAPRPRGGEPELCGGPT